MIQAWFSALLPLAIVIASIHVRPQQNLALQQKLHQEENCFSTCLLCIYRRNTGKIWWCLFLSSSNFDHHYHLKRKSTHGYKWRPSCCEFLGALLGCYCCCCCTRGWRTSAWQVFTIIVAQLLFAPLVAVVVFRIILPPLKSSFFQFLFFF